MITIDDKQILRAQRSLANVKGGAIKAIVPALNRAATSVRTEATRETKKRYYGKVKNTRNDINIKKARYNNPVAAIEVKGRVNPLTRFSVTPRTPNPSRKAPTIIRVVRGQGGAVPGVFVARMKSGHIGVFERTGKSRTPIRQKFGPATPQMVGHESIVNTIEYTALVTLTRRMDHEIDRLMRRGLK